MEENKRMVRAFASSVLAAAASGLRLLLLDPNSGEIHVVHKTKPPYDQWNLADALFGENEAVLLPMTTVDLS